MEDNSTIISALTEELGSFSVMPHEDVSSDGLLEAIHRRVVELMDQDPALLFSYLYRLDVKEDLVNQALQLLLDPSPTKALANIIYDRQKERVRTKMQFIQKPIKGWEW